MQTIPPCVFAARLHALARPEAFPFPVSTHEPVEVIQTHASAVLLAGDRAYKLKKPENFGFFDYSTPELRRHFCGAEMRLNARLAPDVYLGVAPVLAPRDGLPRFGPTLAPDQTPLPGARLESGCVVDYAVVMRRLPEEATLEAHVAAGTATPQMLDAVARRVAAFHAAHGTNADIARFGALDVIAGNWEENLAQMRPYIGRALDELTFQRIATYVHEFLAQRTALFTHRICTGCIRDCHGDLRLQHVYFLGDGLPGRSPDPSRIAIVDCIEFNERFRYSDVAAELAFLTMELDLAGRSDLARTFVDAYVAASGDEALRELLPFYACYRACVRGKVLSFQLDEVEVPQPQRDYALAEARKHFDLADFYAGGPTRPTLLFVGGLMGTGKSSLAAALHTALGWPVFSSDSARKQLAHRSQGEPDASAFGEGIYSHMWSARTYAALRTAAAETLGSGRSVILDASFARRNDRLALARTGRELGARVVFAECVCPPSLALARLRRRWKARSAQRLPVGTPSAASDGRPALYASQEASWEPWTHGEEAWLTHTVVRTDRPLPVSTAAILDVLEVPRPACWVSAAL